MKPFKKALAVLLSVTMLAGTFAVPAVAAGEAGANSPGASKEFTAEDVVIPDLTFNGHTQEAKVTIKVGDKVLVEGEDFVVRKGNKNWAAGTYTVTIEGLGAYGNVTVTKTYKINPDANGQMFIEKKGPKLKLTIGVTNSNKKTIKTSWFKKKAKRTYVINSKRLEKNASLDKNLKPVSYKIVKTPKGAAKYVSIKQNGKITFKKGAPKGKYVVQVTSNATNNYLKATKKVTFTIK